MSADTDAEDAAPAGEAGLARPALLPSELNQQPALRWPGDVATLTRIAVPTLKAMRSAGDHPRMFALGRALFTTVEDVREWIIAHEVPRGGLARRRSK